MANSPIASIVNLARHQRQRIQTWLERIKPRAGIITGGLMMAVAVGAIVYTLVSRPVPITPLPADRIAGLPYPVYYPSQSISGYNLRPSSVTTQAGILFFILSSGAKQIVVAEQLLPASGVSFSSLPHHSDLQVPIGKAILRTGLRGPEVIIMATPTLIALTGNKTVPASDVVTMARAMERYGRS